MCVCVLHVCSERCLHYYILGFRNEIEKMFMNITYVFMREHFNLTALLLTDWS